MQAAIRRADRAILAVGEMVDTMDDADIVTLTPNQQAHWKSLRIPPGEVMALGDDGTLFVLRPAPVDPRLAELRALVLAHPDPLVHELARRAGLLAEEGDDEHR